MVYVGYWYTDPVYGIDLLNFSHLKPLGYHTKMMPKHLVNLMGCVYTNFSDVYVIIV